MRIDKKIALTALLLVSACAVGPDYQRPEMAMPAAFKEAEEPGMPDDTPPVDREGDDDMRPYAMHDAESAATDTTPAPAIVPESTPPQAAIVPDAPEEAKKLEKAEPRDDAPRSKWWEVYNDSQLNALEEQVETSNQSVKAAEASFRQARVLVAEARAAFFPTVNANAAMTRGKSAGKNVANSYSGSLEAAWVPDFWGKVRRELEQSEASAQASRATLASAVLTIQAELAVDYLSLRIADEQERILNRTIEAYSRSLEITENQYKTGVVVSTDVLQARVQLQNAQAQAIDIGVQRAQFEHAIAVLVGKAPAEFSIAVVDDVPLLPEVPAGVPSQLLERRPDVAAAERLAASANASIGVAEAAYFPDITLSATGGYDSSSLSKWFTLPSRFWTIGPSLVETLFDAGLRSAQTEAAIAAYDQAAANYRQSVLAAFQSVEDNLAQLRIFAQEAEVVDSEVKDADKSVTIFINQYKAGTVSYLNVVTAQTAALSARLTALNLRKQRLVASTALIENLGGGWQVADLGKPEVTQGQTTPLSILPFGLHKQE